MGHNDIFHGRPKRHRLATQRFQVGSSQQNGYAPSSSFSHNRRAKRPHRASQCEEHSSDDGSSSQDNKSTDSDEMHQTNGLPANGTEENAAVGGMKRQLPKRACQLRLEERQRRDVARNREDPRSKKRHRHRSSGKERCSSRVARELESLLDRSHNFALEDCEIRSNERYNMRKTRKEVEHFQARDPSPEVPPNRRSHGTRSHRRHHSRGTDSDDDSDVPTENSSSDGVASQKSTSTASNLSDLHRRNMRLFKKYKMSIDPDGQSLHTRSKREKVARRMDSIGDVTPLSIDKSITWDSIGGLAHHIRALKEMVVLPLLYPEVYEKFKVNPPMGVLFIGPPGTGKTLLARSLANACTIGDRKVTFFMRKGADVLSKWVGESEKQLRMLFEEAKKRQPSIIFFDELDGLAPVRSSKSDHTHAAIVSTLLALIDGLDSRGQVILIGATNRIDTIDPALRRPGRFDRELVFSLPNKQARETILHIHTKGWRPALSNSICTQLAMRTVGYSGADLRALCVEAPLRALRRTFPQVYYSSERLLIDLSKVTVTLNDWEAAMADITPAARRNLNASQGIPFPPHLKKCLSSRLLELKEVILRAWPAASLAYGDDRHEEHGDLLRVNLQLPFSYQSWVIIHGEKGMGQMTLLRATLHSMECLPKFAIGMDTAISGLTDEEMLINTFAEAQRSAPSVLCIPSLDSWWNLVSHRARHMLRRLLTELPGGIPMLVLITLDTLLTSDAAGDTVEMQGVDDDGLSSLLQQLSTSHQYLCQTPSAEERRAIWQYVADVDIRVPPPLPPLPKAQWPLLQRDPNPPKLALHSTLPEDIEQRKRHEDSCIRQLRVFVRDTILRLTNDRKFSQFLKLMDPPESKDYCQAVKHPIWLLDCLTKCNEGKYTTIQQFVTDIETLVKNTRKYYGELDDKEGKCAKAVGKVEQLYDYVMLDISRMDGRLLGVCSKIQAEKDAEIQLASNPPPPPPPPPPTPPADEVAVSEPPPALWLDEELAASVASTNAASYVADEQRSTGTKVKLAVEGHVPRSPSSDAVANDNALPASSSTLSVASSTATEPSLPNEGLQEAERNDCEADHVADLAPRRTPSKRVAAAQARGKWSADKSASRNATSTSSSSMKILSIDDIQRPAVLPIQIDTSQVRNWVDKMVAATEGCGVDQLEKCYSYVATVVYEHRASPNKAELLDRLLQYAGSLQSNLVKGPIPGSALADEAR